ncbi:MAG: hypothetical protein AAFX90_20840 [Pseudomonadota bacterium]
MQYALKVWGAFDVRAPDGRSLRPTVRKSCALLAVLALSEGNRQSRKWLQALLWSESTEARGAASLRQELARLKRLLGDALRSDSIDVWFEPGRFEIDHTTPSAVAQHCELLQGMDVGDEAFEDWLREQRQVLERPIKATVSMDVASIKQRKGSKKCLVVFDCDTKGSLDANVAAMYFSEQLFRKLSQFDFFTCISPEAAARDVVEAEGQNTAIVRITAIANRDEVCLGVQVDNGHLGPRLGYQSVTLPYGMSRLADSTELWRLVQQTTDILIDGLDDEAIPESATYQSVMLTQEARRLTFRLDQASLARADLLLARAYELNPRGRILGWRAYLRNSAFFQHRTSDIFNERLDSEALSLEALHQSPNDALVQAFSSQLDYVNQGNLMEPMIKAERAVELDRSDPLARALLSNTLTVNGRLDEGYQVAKQSIVLARGGMYEFYFHHFACMAATASGNYETALHHSRSSVSYAPDFVSPRRYEVALATKLGDIAGVERALEAMRRTEPDFQVAMMLDPKYPVNTLRRLPLIEAIA